MKTLVEPRHRRAVAEHAFERSSTATLIDSRPQAVAQRKLFEAMDRSPRVVARCALIDSINQSPRLTVQRALLKAVPQERRAPMPAQHAQGGGPIQLGKNKNKNNKNKNKKKKKKSGLVGITKPRVTPYAALKGQVDDIFAATELNAQIDALTVDVLEQYIATLESSIAERTKIDEIRQGSTHKRRTNQERKRLGRLLKRRR
jgi:hypothetical protein